MYSWERDCRTWRVQPLDLKGFRTLLDPSLIDDMSTMNR
jgi:hypothetical protein